MGWPDAVFWSIVVLSFAAVAIVFLRTGGYIEFKDPPVERMEWRTKTTTTTFPEKKEDEDDSHPSQG